MKTNVKNRKINSRYWGIFAFILIIALLIFWFALKVSVIDAKEWNEKADSMLQLDSIRPALPMRGSILACDGTPIAQTIALYTAYIDFAAERLDDTLYINVVHPDKSLPDTLFLDTICTYLAEHYPVKTKQQYIDYISNKKKKKARDCFLAENITEDQYNELYNLSPFAFRRKSRRLKRSGLTKVRTYRRCYPYGGLASVVLGRASELTAEMIKKNPDAYLNRAEWHGTSGLEAGLDSLLFGMYGRKQKQQMSNGFSIRVVDPPVAGYDVCTTLDMAIQEITERELMKVVSEQHAASGTAIVMDVKTGEIRSMANVERNKAGLYTFKTNRNYAITRVEPGSVIKTLSLLISMEHGHVDLERKFDSHGAIPEIGGYKSIEAHLNPLTPRDVIVYSDNRGICKIVSDNYRGKYNDFVRDIYDSGLMQTMNLPLPGALPPAINPIKFHEPWTYYSFAQMVFGYYNLLSPLTTLSVYNAIANDGRLMQPKLVKSLLRDNKVDTVFPPVCLNERFCSPSHAASLREMLHGVVQEGTARGIKFGRVDIAGKTGTVDAQNEYRYKDKDGVEKTRLEYDRSKRRLAFAGFFPYEKPQYSCIVVIDKPDLHSAGRVSGGVFRAIAEEMYSHRLLDEHVVYESTVKEKAPLSMKGRAGQAEQVYAVLKQYPLPDTVSAEQPDTLPVSHKVVKVVPSVVGMGAKDALFLLEAEGLAVELSGRGRVVSQSLPAGTPLHKGKCIVLTLN